MRAARRHRDDDDGSERQPAAPGTGAVCLQLLCDTHTPPDLFSNGVLLARPAAFPRARQPLLSFPANLRGGTAASKISLPPPFPVLSAPSSPALSLSFWRINFCSSQLRLFDVRNDEAVEIGIDTSEDRGGGKKCHVHESSVFLEFSPIDNDLPGPGLGRGLRGARRGRGGSGPARLLLSTDQLQLRQAGVTCDSQCQFHARGNHLRKSRAGFTFDKKSAAFVFVKRPITECDRSQRLPGSVNGPSGVCQGPASIYFKWVPPPPPPQART